MRVGDAGGQARPLPVRDGENGPRQAAGSDKNSSIIHFWFGLSTPRISSIAPQAAPPRKEHFKVWGGEIRKKKFWERFPSQSLIKADVIFRSLIG